MVISICEDNLIGREIEKELVLRYCQERGITDMDIMEYDSPIQLAKDLERIESDVYLLDINFPDGNGIELAREIRLRYHHNPIIFITGSQEDTLNAFKVFALRYIVKPIKPKELFETLDYAASYLSVNEPSYFVINTVEGKQRIRFSAIMYVERSGQALLISTNSGKVHESVTLRESFASKLKPLLEEERFVQTHVSFLVNLDAVDTCGKDHVIMQDGRRIPISRSFSSAVKEKFQTYFC